MEEVYNDSSVSKYIYWLPRILGILFVLFLMLFSLDVFQPGVNPGEIALGLFIHNIPALLLLSILIISWKYEIVGGVAFTLAGLFYAIMMAKESDFKWYMLSWIATVSGPALLVGILFTFGWINKKKLHSQR